MSDYISVLQRVDLRLKRSLNVPLDSSSAGYVDSLVTYCQSLGDVLAWSQQEADTGDSSSSLLVTFADSEVCSEAQKALNQLPNPIRATTLCASAPEHRVSGELPFII